LRSRRKESVNWWTQIESVSGWNKAEQQAQRYYERARSSNSNDADVGINILEIAPYNSPEAHIEINSNFDYQLSNSKRRWYENN
jgi:hypothetical protein